MLPLLASSKTSRSTHIAVLARLSAKLLLVVCAFVLPSAIRAQEPANSDDVLKFTTDLRVFPIRIKDKRGSIAALTENELSLEDKDHVTAGLYFLHGADRVALLFALDESGSLREIISQQRVAALGLFNRFSDRSKVAVMRFAQQPLLVADFSRDTKATDEAFSFLARTNQHTAIFDAASAALRAFDVLPRFKSERRIVVLISDGLDNASSIKPAQVIATALEKNVSFYVIHLPLFEPREGHLGVRPPAKGFRDLAEKTGGKYFLVGQGASALVAESNRSNTDLAPIFQAIEDDLRSQYLLGYYAGEGSRDGRDHKFRITFPVGVEYQIAGFGYSRTHDFFVKTQAK